MLVHYGVRRWCRGLDAQTHHLKFMCQVNKTSNPSANARLIVCFSGAKHSPHTTNTQKSQQLTQYSWVNNAYNTPLQILIHKIGFTREEAEKCISSSQAVHARFCLLMYSILTSRRICAVEIVQSHRNAEKGIFSRSKLRLQNLMWHMFQILFMDQIGMTNAMMKKAIQKSPKVLGCNIETLRKLVDWFTELGVPSRKVISSN